MSTAGTGNLQTQTQHSEEQGQGAAGHLSRRGLVWLGPPWSRSPVPACAVREEHEEERSPGHGGHSHPEATDWAGLPQASLIPAPLGSQRKGCPCKCVPRCLSPKGAHKVW